MNGRRAELAGSAPLHSGETPRTAIAPDRQLTASIILRRRPGTADLGEQLLSGKTISREAAAAQIEADPSDIAAVEAFAGQYGLHVVESDAAKRIVKVAGTAQDFDRAFGIQLGQYGNYTSYSGPLTLPESLDGVIVAVLGLDNRPIAAPRTVSGYR
ncbi:MAG: protease pro-enzyme activation domain-containing protein [Acidobacteriota bacterium]|nr:protease pro-enzyme activation domain-containing protein [Acidobacteriota bacterium]